LASSFPTATKSFSSKTDGPSQTISAAHINDLQDEVVAIENDLRVELGHALTFPATQVASTDVHALDDYEEGTWTPVLGGGGGTSGQTYAIQVGSYVKIGKLVTAYGYVALTNKGTITDGVEIQGLPFAQENTTNLFASGAISYWIMTSTFVFLALQGKVNSTAVGVWGAKVAATTPSQLLTADVSAVSQLIFSIQYRATT
jgi:hypothetical protein